MYLRGTGLAATDMQTATLLFWAEIGGSLGAAFSGWADNLLTPSDDVELTSGVVIDQNGTGEAYNAKTSAPDFYADL